MSFALLLFRTSVPAWRQVARQFLMVRCMSAQLTDRVMMVRPSLFKSNQDTVGDNAFQSHQKSISDQEVHSAAIGEFDAYAKLIEQAGIEVNVVEDSKKLPDAVYPNNWISFHSPVGGGEDGKAKKPVIALFPMMSASRREERRPDIIQSWVHKLGAEIKDYSEYEGSGLYLEGTGSMVLDRTNKIIYACLSRRTNEVLLNKFCQDFESKLISFKAHSTTSGSLVPIYHTNVMMSIGTSFAIVCVESITDVTERETVCESLTSSGKTIISISEQQMRNFAGNVLQLRSTKGHTVLAMSTQAYRSLTDKQLEAFAEHSCTVVHSKLDTLEKYGGGGARCMIAEVFPPLASE